MSSAARKISVRSGAQESEPEPDVGKEFGSVPCVAADVIHPCLTNVIEGAAIVAEIPEAISFPAPDFAIYKVEGAGELDFGGVNPGGGNAGNGRVRKALVSHNAYFFVYTPMNILVTDGMRPADFVGPDLVSGRAHVGGTQVIRRANASKCQNE
jgi:hypothetical protein